jgi:tRNA A-37 threonylcarbamoyl transferase component Bud32
LAFHIFIPVLLIMVKFSLFDPLDIWILTINDDFSRIVPKLLEDDELLKKTDFRQPYADFSVLPMQNGEGPFLIKKIKYQIAADYIRRYLGKSQASREFHAAQILGRLNIACPAPVLNGTNISPRGAYESIFICRYLHNHLNGHEFLKNHQNPSVREAFFRAVARDLALIHGNDLFHKDTNFGNIMYDLQEPDKVYWIDNDVKKMGSKFDEYEKVALQRFQNALKKNYINNEEWNFFLDYYRRCLTKS